MKVDWNSVIQALAAGASIPLLKAIFDYLRNKKKDQADAADTLIGSSIKVSQQWEDRVTKLENDIRLMRKRELTYQRNQRELLKVIKELKEIMKEQGIDYEVKLELEEIPV